MSSRHVCVIVAASDTSPCFTICLPLAEVRFIEKLSNKTVVVGDKVVLQTIVENPHQRAVKWYRNGVEITDSRYAIKSNSFADVVDRSEVLYYLTILAIQPDRL